MRDDRDLVRAINQGDEAAFDLLYQRHKDYVMRMARRFGADHDEALDVLQECFSYLLGKVPNLRLEARMTTFLYPVVRNTTTRIVGKRAASAELPRLVARDEARADDARAALLDALGSLDSEQREIVLLRHVDGLSLQEIAESMAIPLGTVKSRLHAATTRLRSLYRGLPGHDV